MRTIRDGNCTNSWKLTRYINIKKDFIYFAINKAFCCCCFHFFFRCYIQWNKQSDIFNSLSKKIERNLNDLVVVPMNMLQYWHRFYCSKMCANCKNKQKRGTMC